MGRSVTALLYKNTGCTAETIGTYTYSVTSVTCSYIYTNYIIYPKYCIYTQCTRST